MLALILSWEHIMVVNIPSLLPITRGLVLQAPKNMRKNTAHHTTYTGSNITNFWVTNQIHSLMCLWYSTHFFGW